MTSLPFLSNFSRSGNSCINGCINALVTLDSVKPYVCSPPIFYGIKWHFPTKAVSVLHYNVQGLLGSPGPKASGYAGNHLKLDYIRSLFNSLITPDIFCISESKLSSRISDSEISIDGFSLFRADRSRRGGGVAIYCKSALQPRAVHLDLNLPLEYAVIKICTANTYALTVCCVYRPSKSKASWHTAFTNLMNHLTYTGASVLVTGGFNIDLLADSSFNNEVHMNFGLQKFITEPTRITATSATLLDQVYSNCNRIHSAGAVELGIADYHATYCCITNKLFNVQRDFEHIHICTTFRSVKKVLTEKVQEVFQQIDMSAALGHDSVDESATSFVELFTSAWDCIAPARQRRTRKNAHPCMNDEVLNLIHEREVAYK